MAAEFLTELRCRDAGCEAEHRAWLVAARSNLAVVTTFASRYFSGQLLDVWTEIIGVGESLRDNPKMLSDVEVVGREIMQRSRRNVERLIVELPKLGYVFEPGEGLETYTPPSADVRSELDAIEVSVGKLPLVLRWWLEDVGSSTSWGTIQIGHSNPSIPLSSKPSCVHQ